MMYLIDNAVLRRELLGDLRTGRLLGSLLVYLGALGAIVWLAWPRQALPDGSADPQQVGRLITLLHVGQYVLMTLMVPALAAGRFSRERERMTSEMLLASPMPPGAVLLGKLFGALFIPAVLTLCSLPLVMPCQSLAAATVFQTLAVYLPMASVVITFITISLTISCCSNRTSLALRTSYLTVLPLALLGMMLYGVLQPAGGFRLMALVFFVPSGCSLLCAALLTFIRTRLTHPPQLGKETLGTVELEREDLESAPVDWEVEQYKALGMVIRTDQFPDRLFAPPKRTDLLPDRANPVHHRETQWMVYGPGNPRLRLTIQLSMWLALPAMAAFCWFWQDLVGWYISYVIAFNLLVGAPMSARTIAAEREHQTLELILTTTLSPWHVFSGKFLASLRISGVLTSFLVWPLLFAWSLPPWSYWNDTVTMIGYLMIIFVTCVTTTTVGVFCSMFFRRAILSVVPAYLVLALLYVLPIALEWLADWAAAGHERASPAGYLQFLSPFAAAFSLPVTAGSDIISGKGAVDLWSATATAFLVFYVLLDTTLIWITARVFRARWWLAQRPAPSHS